jgi:hypothetical protein
MWDFSFTQALDRTVGANGEMKPTIHSVVKRVDVPSLEHKVFLALLVEAEVDLIKN